MKSAEVARFGHGAGDMNRGNIHARGVGLYDVHDELARRVVDDRPLSDVSFIVEQLDLVALLQPQYFFRVVGCVRPQAIFARLDPLDMKPPRHAGDYQPRALAVNF